DLDAAATEVFHRFLDRPGPDEAKVAVSWFDRFLSVQASEPGSVDVQLPLAEAIVAEPLVLLVNLSTKHVAIERVRAFPIGYRDHAVVDHDTRQHECHRATDRLRATPDDGTTACASVLPLDAAYLLSNARLDAATRAARRQRPVGVAG